MELVLQLLEECLLEAVGAASGAVTGGVGFGVGGLVAGLPGLGGAVLGGALAGAAASGVGQVTTNLMTPCVKWNTGLDRAMFWGGVTGGIAGGVGYGLRQRYIVYRNPHPSEHPAALTQGFRPRNPQATYSVAYHVSHGNVANTQYVSTSRSLAWTQSQQTPGIPIYRVDLLKVQGEVIDLTDEAVRNALIRNPVTNYWAARAYEVLIRGNIPPEAILGVIP